MKYLLVSLLLFAMASANCQIVGNLNAIASLEATWIGNDSILISIGDQMQPYGPDQTKIFTLVPDTSYQLKVITKNQQEYIYTGNLPKMQNGIQYVQINLNNQEVEWLNYETEIDQKVRIKLEEILADQNLEKKQLEEVEKAKAAKDAEKIKLENERLEKEKLEKERLEIERLENEKREKERLKNETINKAIHSIEVVLIPGGKFKMGINKDPEEREDTKPVHKVTLNNFYMGKTEITFAQYDAFCLDTNQPKPNDCAGGRGDLPVINISWEDAKEFCKWLSSKTGKSYRLPTEAEWEYACRAGSETLFSTGDCLDENYANYNGWFNFKKCGKGTNNGKTVAAGIKYPNKLGISDLHGNVAEYCSDWYGENYYSESPKENPQGPSTGTYRVIRGGSFLSAEISCNSYSRLYVSPYYFLCCIGFRVASDN
jgi:formylglycine-generating enzyme